MEIEARREKYRPPVPDLCVEGSRNDFGEFFNRVRS